MMGSKDCSDGIVGLRCWDQRIVVTVGLEECSDGTRGLRQGIRELWRWELMVYEVNIL